MVFPGFSLFPQLCPDWQVDYNSYTPKTSLKLPKHPKNPWESLIFLGFFPRNPRVFLLIPVFPWFFPISQLCPDWQVDYESYTWRKLDPDSAECRTLVTEYFLWEGEFRHVGKPFNQGKIFK